MPHANLYGLLNEFGNVLRIAAAYQTSLATCSELRRLTKQVWQRAQNCGTVSQLRDDVLRTVARFPNFETTCSELIRLTSLDFGAVIKLKRTN